MKLHMDKKVNVANEYQTPMSLITWMSKDNMDDSINQIEWNLPYKCLDSTNVLSNQMKKNLLMFLYGSSLFMSNPKKFAFFMSM